MKKISLPEPDEVFKERPSVRKYLRYLYGAWSDLRLLWLITINVASLQVLQD